MSSLSNLTIIIATCKNKEKILTDCINSIDKNVKVKIIENSPKFKMKDKFKNLFPIYLYK